MNILLFGNTPWNLADAKFYGIYKSKSPLIIVDSYINHPSEIGVPIFDSTDNDDFHFLDGKTVLIERDLKEDKIQIRDVILLLYMKQVTKYLKCFSKRVWRIW